MLNTLQDIEKSIDLNTLSIRELAIKQLEEVIFKMPKEIQHLIQEGFLHKRIPKEYTLGAVIFAFSTAAGLSFEINAMNYTNHSNLYFALIGSRGDVKSPAIDLATAPLNKYDAEEYSKHQLIKQEDPTSTIPRSQIFIQDATIEAVIQVHQRNPRVVGIQIDEINILVQKMANKSNNDGIGYKTLLLQGNTNKHIDIARKTTDSFRINKSYPTLIGTLQTDFIPKLFADGNLESGLIDRLLFTTKLTNNTKLSKFSISKDVLANYSQSLMNLLESSISIWNSGEPLSLRLTDEANKKIYEYSQNLIDKQVLLTDCTREYISKMLISIHKLTLLVHLINNCKTNDYDKLISIESVDTAKLINEFYFTNFRIIAAQNEKSEKEATDEQIVKRAIKNNAAQKDVAAVIGKNKSTVSRLYAKYLQLATAEKPKQEHN